MDVVATFSVRLLGLGSTLEWQSTVGELSSVHFWGYLKLENEFFRSDSMNFEWNFIEHFFLSRFNTDIISRTDWLLETILLRSIESNFGKFIIFSMAKCEMLPSQSRISIADMTKHVIHSTCLIQNAKNFPSKSAHLFYSLIKIHQKFNQKQILSNHLHSKFEVSSATPLIF